MMSRIIIFTGKGGVGKTMVSTAHAVASSEEGKKTLLVSTDMAHNLGDILGRRIGSSVQHVSETLDAVELDPDLIMRHDFPDFMKSYEALLKSAGVESEEQDQFTVIPGMENLFSLMKIRQFYESGEYERIIVDCAPSGETISMLKLPELLAWYFEKLFPVGRMAIRILSPFSKVFMKVEMPDQEALSDVEKLYKTMLEIQDLIKDSEVTTVRLVCTPEKMVVDETKRSFMYLNLYHYQVDGLYINRVIPELEGNAFMSKWHQIQAGYIEELAKYRGIFQDAYVIGVHEPCESFTGIVIGIVYRRNDSEAKWIVSKDPSVNHQEVIDTIGELEQYFDTRIIWLDEKKTVN